MHFRHISVKIQLKNLKKHFDWWEPAPPCLRPCAEAHNLGAGFRGATRYFAVT